MFNHNFWLFVLKLQQLATGSPKNRMHCVLFTLTFYIIPCGFNTFNFSTLYTELVVQNNYELHSLFLSHRYPQIADLNKSKTITTN